MYSNRLWIACASITQIVCNYLTIIILNSSLEIHNLAQYFLLVLCADFYGKIVFVFCSSLVARNIGNTPWAYHLEFDRVMLIVGSIVAIFPFWIFLDLMFPTITWVDQILILFSSILMFYLNWCITILNKKDFGLRCFKLVFSEALIRLIFMTSLVGFFGELSPFIAMVFSSFTMVAFGIVNFSEFGFLKIRLSQFRGSVIEIYTKSGFALIRYSVPLVLVGLISWLRVFFERDFAFAVGADVLVTLALATAFFVTPFLYAQQILDLTLGPLFFKSRKLSTAIFLGMIVSVIFFYLLFWFFNGPDLLYFVLNLFGIEIKPLVIFESVSYGLSLFMIGILNINLKRVGMTFDIFFQKICFVGATLYSLQGLNGNSIEIYFFNMKVWSLLLFSLFLLRWLYYFNREDKN